MSKKSVPQMMADVQQIRPLQNRRIKSVTKQADGSLLIVPTNGDEYTIPAGETEMQAFALWSFVNQ
jgi:hypothetical protein